MTNQQEPRRPSEENQPNQQQRPPGQQPPLMSPEIAGFYSEEAQAKPPSRSNLPVVALVGCVVGFVCFCCAVPVALLTGAGVVASILEANEVTASSTETLEINDPNNVTLVVENPVGEVIINGDPDAEAIRVEISRTAYGLTEDRAQNALDDLDVTVERSGNNYRVSVGDPDDNFLENLAGSSADLNITVPESLNIEANSNVGAIRVRNVTIRDRLDIQSDVGQIEFEGVIGPAGRHTLQTDVGSIDVRVRRPSAFNLTAQTDTGEITVDFNEGPNSVDTTEDGPQAEFSYTYVDERGQEPAAELDIETSTGSIDLSD